MTVDNQQERPSKREALAQKPPKKQSEASRLHRQKRRLKFKQSGLTCFACRQIGHTIATCPQKDNETKCYICNEETHIARDCPRKGNNTTNYINAECFFCKEIGHIASQCTKNKKGKYPEGGCCKFCGSVRHLAGECDRMKKKRKEDEEITLDMDEEVVVAGNQKVSTESKTNQPPPAMNRDVKSATESSKGLTGSINATDSANSANRTLSAEVMDSGVVTSNTKKKSSSKKRKAIQNTDIQSTAHSDIVSEPINPTDDCETKLDANLSSQANVSEIPRDSVQTEESVMKPKAKKSKKSSKKHPAEDKEPVEHGSMTDKTKHKKEKKLSLVDNTVSSTPSLVVDGTRSDNVPATPSNSLCTNSGDGAIEVVLDAEMLAKKLAENIEAQAQSSALKKRKKSKRRDISEE